VLEDTAAGAFAGVDGAESGFGFDSDVEPDPLDESPEPELFAVAAFASARASVR
jgi:hypothetical protein